jgi:hypothetical protein
MRRQRWKKLVFSRFLLFESGKKVHFFSVAVLGKKKEELNLSSSEGSY